MNVDVRVVPAYCRTITHLAKSNHQCDRQLLHLLFSSKQKSVLEDIQSIQLGCYRADLNFKVGTIHYLGRHTDPLFIFENNQCYQFEMTLYDVDGWLSDYSGQLEITSKNQIKYNHSLFISRPESIGFDYDILSSQLFFDNQRLLIKIDACQSFSLISQRMDWGCFTEVVEQYSAGQWSIPLEPGFAEYYGYSISTQSNDGIDYEVKHIVYGQLGHASGRDFLNASTATFYQHKLSLDYHYQALICWIENPDDVFSLASELNSYHEIEFFTSNKQMQQVSQVLEKYLSTNYRLMTVATGEDAYMADVIVIKTSAELLYWSTQYPQKKLSYLLFGDALSKDYFSMLQQVKQALQDCEINVKLLDLSWFYAIESVDYSSEKWCYGIAYSHPNKNTVLRWQLEIKTAIHQRKRFMMKSSVCMKCQQRLLCDQIVSIPYLVPEDLSQCITGMKY
ncbi:MAG: hypothetical protein HON94_05405 [Methylococcales bacterium]|nr:hypothetical protein [Methylococcales bacterium]MBT7408435.1 hypothetical protein [Methylococcales bacterium]